LFQSLATPGELGEDRIHGGCPDKRLRIFVPGGEELVNCGDEIVDTEKGIAADALVS
jgi:hypothetical protein